MTDVVSTQGGINLAQLPDVKEIRIRRDRQIALEFVRLEESRTARSEIAQKFGLNIRLVYRAIEAQLAWAREEIKKGQVPTTKPDPDQTASSDACPAPSVAHESDAA